MHVASERSSYTVHSGQYAEYGKWTLEPFFKKLIAHTIILALQYTYF